MAASPSEIYQRQLLATRNGYPLWVPEPFGNSVTYRTKGVRIGDVGYITTDGGFKALFNIRAAPDHPVNRLGVPDDFEQVQIQELGVDHRAGCLVVTSLSMQIRGPGGPGVAPVSQTFTRVEASQIQYSCTSSAGAILCLPEGASRIECSNRDKLKLRDQAEKHAVSWYKFALTYEDIPEYSLCLVTGIDKTSKWMVGSFSNCSSDQQVAFQVDAVEGEEGISYRYSWGPSLTPVQRVSSSMDRSAANGANPTQLRIDDEVFSTDAPHGHNQCVFIRGFTISLRSEDLLRIFHSIQLEEPNDDVHLRPMADNAQPYHPSTTTNHFLLDWFGDANVAITHDDEWTELIHDDDTCWPRDSVLEERAKQIYVNDIPDYPKNPPVSQAAFLIRRSMNNAVDAPAISVSMPKTSDGREIPLDIIRLILEFARVPDLIACLQTCRSVHAMAEDTLIKYRIEAYFAGALTLINDPAQSNTDVDTLSKTTVPERLELLRRRETAWRAFRPDFRKSVPLPFEPSQLCELSGGVLVLGQRTEDFHKVGGTGTSALRYVKLPSTENEEIAWKSLDVNKDIVDFGLSVDEHDLIAIATSSPSAYDPSFLSISIALLQLSTGQPHPLAALPNLPLFDVSNGQSSKLSSICIRISGRYLALIAMAEGIEPMMDRFIVFDWMSGNLILDNSPAQQGVYLALVFLSPTILLITNGTERTFDIWEFTPSQATHIGSLCLPVSPKYNTSMIRSEPPPSLTFTSSSERGVYYDPQESIIVLGLCLFGMLFVSRRRELLNATGRLRTLAARNTDLHDKPPSLQYSQWASRAARWVPTIGLTKTWNMRAAGQRMVAIDIGPVGPGGRDAVIIRLFDFNPCHVRKWGSEVIGSEDGDGSRSSSSFGLLPSSRVSLPELTVEKQPAKHSRLPMEVEQFPCITYTNEEICKYADVCMDEERIVGLKAKESPRDMIFEMEILHFG